MRAMDGERFPPVPTTFFSDDIQHLTCRAHRGVTPDSYLKRPQSPSRRFSGVLTRRLCRRCCGEPQPGTAVPLVVQRASSAHGLSLGRREVQDRANCCLQLVDDALCRRCLLSKKHMARRTEAQPGAAAVCRGQGRPHGGPREAGGRPIYGRCALRYPHRHQASTEGFAAVFLSDVRCSADYLHGPCAGHGYML